MTSTKVNSMEMISDYGDVVAEYAALRSSAGILNLSSRSRLVLTGADRARFLHGQVTNDIKRLRPGEGCYAALITAKGKLQSDLYIYCLDDELLLDFEPGLAATVTERLEKYVIADDVQVVDAAPHYGLLSIQGPRADAVVRGLELKAELPTKAFTFVKVAAEEFGEVYLANQPRLGSLGFDLFVPTGTFVAAEKKLQAATGNAGGLMVGWQAYEIVRVEAGVPRFGADMDETNIPLEAGLEDRAISFNKGCYIGQEVISRIRTYGQVAKALRGLRLASDLGSLPAKGDKLFHEGKEVGYVTTAVASPALKANIALGYVRKECNQVGTRLTLRGTTGESQAEIVALPFV